MRRGVSKGKSRSAVFMVMGGVVLGVAHHALSRGWVTTAPLPASAAINASRSSSKGISKAPSPRVEVIGWAKDGGASAQVNVRDYPLDPFPQAPCLDTSISLAEVSVPDRSLAPPVLHPVVAARLHAKVLAQGTDSGGVGVPYIPRSRDACTRYYHRDAACPIGEPWRLVVAIAAAVLTRPAAPDAAQPLLTDLAPSLAAGLDPTFAYRLYLAYDTVDPVFGTVAGRTAATDTLLRAANGDGDGVRCFTGAPPGTTLPPLVSVHWVPCEDCSGYPARAQSRAATTAVLEGAEYVLRINDDTRLPPSGAWTAAYINTLLTHTQLPNFGVIGPYEPDAHPGLLRLHFTHRTHTRIFGDHYPASLPDMCVQYRVPV